MKTAFEIAHAVRSGAARARDVVATYLAEIAGRDPDLKAFVSVDVAGATAAAEEVDRRVSRGETIGALAGVPIAVKDNVCTAGLTTTCSSNILRNYVSPYDAHVVERLRAAGAIVVGKTNLDEFAMGSSTENSAFFATRNAWDGTRVPGGSSGGSATAVAAGMVPCALGSDTGGSIRQPAGLSGVVGLKPTYGRVSRYGLAAFGSSLDQIGPITRDVRDAALVLSVIAGRDERDSTSVERSVPDYCAILDGANKKKLRVGIAAEYFGDGLDDEVRGRVTAALDAFRSAGAELIEVRLPHVKYAIACYYVAATAEASSNLARYDGVRYGHRTSRAGDVFDLYARSRGEGFGAEVKRRIMLGTFVLSSGYYDAYYKKALKVRTLIKRDFEEAFQRVDVIASPVTPTTAFALGEKSSDPLAMYLGDIYTTSLNLAGLPGISVPCGFDRAGLPVGLQLAGPWFGEESLLAAARLYENLRGEWRMANVASRSAS